MDAGQTVGGGLPPMAVGQPQMHQLTPPIGGKSNRRTAPPTLVLQRPVRMVFHTRVRIRSIFSGMASSANNLPIISSLG